MIGAAIDITKDAIEAFLYHEARLADENRYDEWFALWTEDVRYWVPANIDDYGRAKNAMVQQILAAAGLTDAERASIDANQVPSHDEVPR